ncbi:hypothetical protein ACFO5K_02045 [Nocardia halotolerans]|uniref:Uncharacterized protein n=1 Tax=Nocardia halotolerans TaxID=1755878 RepID=A0ABV8VAI3_9NOCA
MSSDLDTDSSETPPGPDEENSPVMWPEPSPLQSWWAAIMAAPQTRRGSRRKS